MGQVATKRAAIVTQLRTITSLRQVSAYQPNNVVLPMAFVGRRRGDPHNDFSDGQTVRYDVVLLVSDNVADLARAEAALDPYLDADGAQSIQAAIEGDPSLMVISWDDEPIVLAGKEYVAATFSVEVMS